MTRSINERVDFLIRALRNPSNDADFIREQLARWRAEALSFVEECERKGLTEELAEFYRPFKWRVERIDAALALRQGRLL
jgi:hypothetical protein